MATHQLALNLVVQLYNIGDGYDDDALNHVYFDVVYVMTLYSLRQCWARNLQVDFTDI